MIVKGQRVESLNCGWVVAQEDSDVFAGVKLDVVFESTGNKKKVLSSSFPTGNMSDRVDIKVGDIMNSTKHGKFEIVSMKNNKSVDVRFLDTGNVVKGLQKNAVVTGYVKDQIKHEKEQAVIIFKKQKASRAYQEKLDRAEYKREQKQEDALRKKRERKEALQAKEKRILDYYNNKALRDIELRANALKALFEIGFKDDTENPTDLNIDFKDRYGKWVLNFSDGKKFYHTRLGRYYNNMSQRIGRFGGYEDVLLDDSFSDAQKFCNWAVEQVGWGCGYQLEKDLLSESKGTYSAETCCFLPSAINRAIIRKTATTVVTKKSDGWHVNFLKNNLRIFLGVYPTQQDGNTAYHKYQEAYVQELANFFKFKISDRAYQALLLWESGK